MEKVSFSLDFKALNDIFDYRECVSGIKEEISKSVASEHLEQFGKATGILKIGDNEYRINGLGERDHSWGIRDWNAPKMWIWLTCQFDEGHALNVTKLIVEQGEVDAGFIHIDGRNIPINKAKIDTAYNNDGSPDSFKMELEDKNGSFHKVSARIIKRSMMLFESPDKKKFL
jgi:predicted secreted hydrolase